MKKKKSKASAQKKKTVLKKTKRKTVAKKKGFTKRSRTIKKKTVKKTPLLLRRYRSITAELSRELKTKGIKLGRDFSAAAAFIYQTTKDQKLSFVKKNIYGFYKEWERGAKQRKSEVESDLVFFPDGFPFYFFTENLGLPAFDGVEITVLFDDGKFAAQSTGFGPDIMEWYIRNLHPYLRKYYNSSPPAEFKIKEYVNGETVTYEVQVGALIEQELSDGDGEVNPETKQPKVPVKPAQKSESELQIELEKEKQKTIQEKVSAVKALKDLGMSMKDIKKYLGF